MPDESRQASTSRRIQLSRRKGFRKPENVIVVARPSKWGNPYTLAAMREFREDSDADLRAECVFDFKCWLDGIFDGEEDRRARILADLHELRGHDLACWCPLDQPCHADVLLEMSNV